MTERKMDKDLYVKFIKFLNNEADRYIEKQLINGDQLRYLTEDIEKFKIRVRESDLHNDFITMTEKLTVSIPQNRVDGSFLNVIKPFIKAMLTPGTLLTVLGTGKRDKQKTVEEFTRFKRTLQEALFVADRY